MSHSNDAPLDLAIVIASTRPGRRGAQVADWVLYRARDHLGDAARVELVDLSAVGLPLLDEAVPAAIGEYGNDHTRAWAATVDRFDGFVFVTPEYNHSVPAALKNAIDFLFTEWNDKAAGFVGYGLDGGVRAIEHLRTTLAEVKVAGVRSQVGLGLFTDFELEDAREPGTFSPADHRGPVLERMLDELVAWSGALRTLRTA